MQAAWCWAPGLGPLSRSGGRAVSWERRVAACSPGLVRERERGQDERKATGEAWERKARWKDGVRIRTDEEAHQKPSNYFPVLSLISVPENKKLVFLMLWDSILPQTPGHDDVTTRRRDDATTARRNDATTRWRDGTTTRRRDNATTR